MHRCAHISTEYYFVVSSTSNEIPGIKMPGSAFLVNGPKSNIA